MTRYALFSGFLDCLCTLFAILSLWHSFYERLEVDVFIPDFEGGHRRVFGHMLPVRLDRCANCFLSVSRPRTCRASRDFDTGGQPFKVPFPGSRERFVKVVDVKNQVALRCGEAAEVHDVAIAARLHAKPGRGGSRQIKSHYGRGAAQKSEGRFAHSAIANREQLRNSLRIRIHQKLDRIRSIRRRFPDRMTLAGYFSAQCAAHLQPRFGRSTSQSTNIRTTHSRSHFRTRGRTIDCDRKTIFFAPREIDDQLSVADFLVRATSIVSDWPKDRLL